jgi:Tfp pilus assembly protein PilF
MRTKTLIPLAAGAVLLLMFGVYRATRPGSVLMSEAEAREQLVALGERFSAAIENRRDVSPLREPLEAIVAQRPGLRDAHTLLGQVHAQQGETREAYEHFGRALEIDGDDAALQNLAGSAAMMIDEPELAETHHRLAVRAAPEEPGYLLPLADVLIKAERWDEARGVLLRALELQLSQHAANALLSDVYAGRGQPGDLQRAIDQMEKARAQVLADPKALEQQIVYVRKLARLYGRQGDPMEALRTLDTLMPEEARFREEVMAELAAYMQRNGQPVLAALQYEAAADAMPADPRWPAEAARWFLEAGDAAAARRMLERLRQIAPRDPAVGELTEKLRDLE